MDTSAAPSARVSANRSHARPPHSIPERRAQARFRVRGGRPAPHIPAATPLHPRSRPRPAPRPPPPPPALVPPGGGSPTRAMMDDPASPGFLFPAPFPAPPPPVRGARSKGLPKKARKEKIVFGFFELLKGPPPQRGEVTGHRAGTGGIGGEDLRFFLPLGADCRRRPTLPPRKRGRSRLRPDEANAVVGDRPRGFPWVANTRRSTLPG